MFRPNHILVTLRWDDGLSPGHENVCRWYLNNYKELLGLSKLRNCVFLGKSSKWNLNFQNWLKALWLGVFEPTKRLATQSAAYALRNRQGKYTLVKKKMKKMSFKIEAAIQRCSVKKVFLKSSKIHRKTLCVPIVCTPHPLPPVHFYSLQI